MVTPSVLVLLLMTILVISKEASGFVVPSVHSSRATAIDTYSSRSAKSPVLVSSIRATADNEVGTDKSSPPTIKVKKATKNPFKMAYRIYTGYAKKLWKETDPSERSKIANDRVAQTVRDMQHVLTSEHETISSLSGSGDDKETLNAYKELLQACDHMMSTIDESEKSKSKTSEISTAVASIDADGEKAKSPPAKTEKKQRSILFGAVMGAVVAAWVFSGNYIFTGLFCLLTILGQLEYYRMVMNTGVFPARRISVIGATSMFVTVRDRQKFREKAIQIALVDLFFGMESLS